MSGVRLGVISDIHIDINNNSYKYYTAGLLEILSSVDLDYLLICGDITPNTNGLNRFFKRINSLNSFSTLFVPGNHDIWCHPDVDPWSRGKDRFKRMNSYYKYFYLLPDVCKKNNIYYLPEKPFILETANQSLALIGSIGWYDYSFRNKSLDIPLEVYYSKYLREYGLMWNDVNFADWGMTDPAITNLLLDKLNEQLTNLSAEVSTIYLALHHVPFQQAITYKDGLEWDFFCAFMGSSKLGEFLLKDNRIEKVFFGHTHFPFSQKISGLEVHCCPIGYLFEDNFPVKTKKDLQELITDRLHITNI